MQPRKKRLQLSGNQIVFLLSLVCVVFYTVFCGLTFDVKDSRLGQNPRLLTLFVGHRLFSLLSDNMKCVMHIVEGILRWFILTSNMMLSL